MNLCSLYVHIPWCKRKCPYCDFYSYPISPQKASEEVDAYIDALLSHARLWEKPLQQANRSIHTVYIGGGTPTLCPPSSIQYFLRQLSLRLPMVHPLEITMEANPDDLSLARWLDYREAGVTRLSIGIQTFHPLHRERLQRNASIEKLHSLLQMAREFPFPSMNLDLMYGLPNQTVEEALQDLTTAIAYTPEHLSWYQLTIEPNTPFARQSLPIADDQAMSQLEALGRFHLAANGYHQYEISAYAKAGHEGEHNLNYWEFGDYIGLGIGAHGKWSTGTCIERIVNTYSLRRYLQGAYEKTKRLVPVSEQALEFFCNQFRLFKSISKQRLLERTDVALESLDVPVAQAVEQGYLVASPTTWKVTRLGHQFLNDLLLLFA